MRFAYEIHDEIERLAPKERLYEHANTLQRILEKDEHVLRLTYTKNDFRSDNSCLVATNWRLISVEAGLPLLGSGTRRDVAYSNIASIDFSSKLMSKYSGTITVATLDGRIEVFEKYEKDHAKDMVDFLKRGLADVRTPSTKATGLLSRSDYFKCPGCKAVLSKPDEGQLLGKLNVLGVVKCGSCGNVVDLRDVQSGQYDL